MALTPLKIVLLLAATLVLSILGIVMMLMGVHGPHIMTVLGGILLLPNVILVRLGVPIGIPLITSTSVVPILVFLILQGAYYYALLWLIYFITYRRRHHSPAV